MSEQHKTNIFSKLNQDLPASLVVFLVALPLCLGVALASGAPLLSGLISGIVGGVVVGMLSQSHTSVSGPAAGLAAVVFSSIAQLGAFDTFLMALVLAGLLQLVAGITKCGFIANYIPSNVIKGLLAAIGIILILKQIPHAVGYDKDPQDDFTFFQKDGENTFSELISIFNYFSWGAVIVASLSLLVLILWDRTPLKKLKFLPSSLFVVVLGVVINFIFQKFFPQLLIQAEHLVQVPKFEGVRSTVTLPNFSTLGNYHVWVVAFSIALIASIETLLNLEAVENIDPLKRQASPNRELVAQGIGNTISGLIGGIPVTSVIVRSSVNINSGAATKMSAIVHGLFLLLSVLVLSPVLNLIPLASLASILIFTGYKLTKVSLFTSMYHKGLSQFIPFVATIVAIIFTDLLIGVVIGLVISIFYVLRSNFQNPFVVQKNAANAGENVRIELPNQTTFLNKASIKDALWAVPDDSKVTIDARYADLIDHDVVELIEDFKSTVAGQKNIKLNIIGFKNNVQLQDQIQFSNAIDKALQTKMTHDDVLQILKQGNQRFLSGHVSEKYLKHQADATTAEQNPLAIVLSCIDSRTTTEHIFDLGLGDIFSIRIAGNILNEDILGSMEFGVHAVGVRLILVLGHTNCGAIKGACDDVKLGNLTTLLDKVKPSIAKEKTVLTNRVGSNYDFVDKVAALNVQHTIDRIRVESSLIAGLESEGKVRLVGGLYNLVSGEVTFYE
jgi:carbonic anhydrase